MRLTVVHKPYRSAKLRSVEREYNAGEVFRHPTLGKILLDEDGFLYAKVPNKRRTSFSLFTRAYVEGKEVNANVAIPNGGEVKSNVDTKYGWFEIAARKTRRSLAWVSIFVEK